MDEYIQLTQQLNTKSKLWSYEKEIRFTKLNLANKTIKVNKKCINEIILGCNISRENKQKIISLIKKTHRELPIFQSYTERNKFKLKFDRLY